MLPRQGATQLEKPAKEQDKLRLCGGIESELADGRIFVDAGDGKILESRVKRLIPLDEKPLNVASGAAELIGNLLSNFTERPFVLDGKRHCSIEAFYQGLTRPDEAVFVMHTRPSLRDALLPLSWWIAFSASLWLADRKP